MSVVDVVGVDVDVVVVGGSEEEDESEGGGSRKQELNKKCLRDLVWS